MRLLLSILLALLLTVVQVYIGLETFFPSVFQEKARVVDELIEDKKPIINKLTPEEQAWITSHGTITVGVDPYFYPIETFDGRGQYSGLGGDYMKLLSHLTGIQFLPLRLNDWAATEHSAQAREVDMYMAAAQTARRSEYMLFTEPYINEPGVIRAPRTSGLHDITVADLHGKKVAVVAAYSWHDFLLEHHPEVEVVPCATTVDALKAVVNGDADAIIDYEFNLKEKIHTAGIMQMEKVGSVESSYGHAIAVRKDWPILFSILKKGMDSITPEEKRELADYWLTQESAPEPADRHLQWLFFFFTEIVMLGFGFHTWWQISVTKATRARIRDIRETNRAKAAAAAANEA